MAVRSSVFIDSVAAGFVTGLRSQLIFAVMARSARRGEFGATCGPPIAWLRISAVEKVITISAANELVVDKLPMTPNRIDPAPLAGRLILGTLAGSALAVATGNRAAGGALGGMMGAVAGSFAGYWARTRSVRATGLPDMVVALTEDAIAIGLARAIVQRASRPDISHPE